MMTLEEVWENLRQNPETKATMEEVDKSYKLFKKIENLIVSDLEAKLAEKEDLLKTYTQLNEDLTKRLDDRCDICIERHKQSQNQIAIAELNNILDTFAIFVNEEKESVVSPDGSGNLSLLEYVENRIDTLKGEK